MGTYRYRRTYQYTCADIFSSYQDFVSEASVYGLDPLQQTADPYKFEGLLLSILSVLCINGMHLFTFMETI